ncbi:MAG TPA: alpha/beta hydrolase [Solirubrobacteraceae bacterium]|jgi:pimeloyl-ACP methyl ester carboxylesterase
MPADASPLSVAAGGVTLSGEQSGGGPGSGGGDPVVLLHGLTATRRYVVMGSRALQRAGYRVLAYDARGHGQSTAAPRRAYGYEHLADDLLAVLDAAGIECAVLAGASMGAHTAVRFALEHPERIAALALITPAFDPAISSRDEQELARWDALSRGLRDGGVEGFVDAYDLAAVPEAWRDTVATVLRQRLSAHEHPNAVADALEVVPRSRPFEALASLAAIAAPTLVVASRDEADPEHPLAVGKLYAETIPGARLVVEDAGVDAHPTPSPIAWQGGQLSKLLIELVSEAVAQNRVSN